MKKPKVSLAGLMEPEADQTPVATPVASAPAAAARATKTHTTLYLSKRVLREIRTIALEFDRKPHDLLIEGIDLMLKQYGRKSVKALSAE
jgi:hypothetical protein